ncbi:ATP-dependent nuclease [Serratia proteamaculans]|uniref:ATP-dependent nuclease n=1 Tax=Serratia proteamaculans TaxID=28151 RepID=UPI002177001C|nr:AAA family ATPase [Serratia proteamaculans]CAI1803384.1 Predicted ATP-binding protein involved in virulence [Serratia proteamaculans]
MYLKSLVIHNFRKFSGVNNKICFVKAGKTSPEQSPVAASTTVIIGKNNSGKTTITNSLSLICSDTEKLTGNDFNHNYLRKILSSMMASDFSKYPEVKFEMEFILDDIHNDITSNFAPFIDISSLSSIPGEDNKDTIAFLSICFRIKDESIFNEKINNLIQENKENYYSDTDVFRRFLDLISMTEFKRVITNNNNRVIEKVKIKNLIDLRVIKVANNIHDQRLLAKSFNRIIKFMYEKNKDELKSILNLVDGNNHSLTEKIKISHQNNVESVLNTIILDESLGIELRANLTFDKLMGDLITYEHRDGENLIPEGQFGLGYANLINIVSEIIDYFNRCLHEQKQLKIQLLCIEEPEVFMHPQMQVNFIRHIEDALVKILGINFKDINSIKSQIIVTTHSSHILNSIIHGSGTFNEINYINSSKGNSECIVLNDNELCDGGKDFDYFKFIKKHVKHQVPELFFSDAIILVEGITEERVINHHIDNNYILSRRNISVFRIDGAHGKVYSNLLKKINIPTLIITDIDFKRDSSIFKKVIKMEDGSETTTEYFPQMEVIDNSTETTNSTLSHFLGSKKVEEYPDHHISDNIYLSYQLEKTSIDVTDSKKYYYYATSFEEAFILQNYENNLLRKVLLGVVGKDYSDIISEKKDDYYLLAMNSFKIQKKLSDSKSAFANSIIYELITSNDIKPVLPSYILNGLSWLENQKRKPGGIDHV